VIDGDLMKEFKLYWTIKNFTTYYNPKQPSLYDNNIKTKSNKRGIWTIL